MDSKNHFLNRSVENNILNFSGNEFNINDDKEEPANPKVQNTVGNSESQYYNQKNPLFQKYEKSSINKGKRLKYRNNSSNKNNKIKRITKLNKTRMSKEINNNSKINMNNINIKNINKDENNQIDYKTKLSPGNQLSDSVEIHKL